MKSKFENIDEALEIEATSVSKEIVKKSKEAIARPTSGEESDKDYEYT